jgi:hypothetical protein
MLGSPQFGGEEIGVFWDGRECSGSVMINLWGRVGSFWEMGRIDRIFCVSGNGVQKSAK